jgi:hypothetical protein
VYIYIFVYILFILMGTYILCLGCFYHEILNDNNEVISFSCNKFEDTCSGYGLTTCEKAPQGLFI